MFPDNNFEDDELNDQDSPIRSLADEAIRGWSGLIELGSAWQSVDIFRALSYSLDYRSHTALASVAHLRIRELSTKTSKNGLRKLARSPMNDISSARNT